MLYYLAVYSKKESEMNEDMKYQVYTKNGYLMEAATKSAIEKRIKNFIDSGPQILPSGFWCWTEDKNGDPLKLRFNENFELIDYSWAA
jgi:hypothetical protein